MAGILGVHDGDFEFVGEGGGDGDDVLEALGGGAGEGGHLEGGFALIVEGSEAGFDVGGIVDGFGEAGAVDALDEDADGFVGEFEELEEAADAAGGVEVGPVDFVVVFAFGLDEGGEEEPASGGDVVDEFSGARGVDNDGGDHAGEEDEVVEGEDGEDGGRLGGGGAIEVDDIVGGRIGAVGGVDGGEPDSGRPEGI